MTIQHQVPRAVYLRCSLRVGLWSGDIEPTEFSDPLNFTKVEISTPVQEQEKLISNMIATYGEALDSQNRPTDPANVAMEFSTLTSRMIELAIGATVTEQVQATGAVADEVIDTALNIWVKAANRYWDSTVTPTLKTSGDVAVDASKWEFDNELGMIRAIHADAVGTGMKLSYTKADRTYHEYDAGKAKSEYVMLVGQALDQVSNKTGILEIHKASLASDGAFDPVAGGYLAGSLAGDLITPTGYNSPWRWQSVAA